MTPAQPFTFEALDGAAKLGVRMSTASRAEEILGRARSEADAIMQAARDQGYAEGHAEGLDAVMVELQPLRESLQAMLGEIAAHRDEMIARTERAAVELSLRLADKILSTALDVRPELVLDVVTGALRRVTDRSSVIVEVNPDDYEQVRTAIEDIAAGLGGFASLDLVPERRVGRGGCTVRLAEGEIGACIDEQLARAGEVLRESLT